MNGRLKPTAAAARWLLHCMEYEANERRLRERRHEGNHMDAQAIINQVRAGLSEVIAHQAEQLLTKDKQIAQLQSAVSQFQQQLQITAAELDKAKKELAAAPTMDSSPAPDAPAPLAANDAPAGNALEAIPG